MAVWGQLETHLNGPRWDRAQADPQQQCQAAGALVPVVVDAIGRCPTSIPNPLLPWALLLWRLESQILLQTAMARDGT